MQTTATDEPKKKPREKPHYVSNKDFSAAVVAYVQAANEAKNGGTEVPRIPNYIGECFMKIAERFAHKPNYMRYTYRDEMVMDAVENCVRAIMNFNVNAPTRTGSVNAFAYFTQITYFAFLRRIAKEKKQQEIKEKIMDNAGIGMFADFEGDESHMGSSIVEKVRQRSEQFRGPREAKEKKPTPEKVKANTGLEDFFQDAA